MHNVEVTGAARLYRAASVLTAGLGLAFPYDSGSSCVAPHVDGGRNPRKSGGTFFSGIKNAMRER
jgi:hypothetical protein